MLHVGDGIWLPLESGPACRLNTLPVPAHEYRAPQLWCQGLLEAWMSHSAFCPCPSKPQSALPLAQVDDVAGNDVVCTARNNASLDGLLTIFHTERSSDTLQNVQNDLQILSQVRTGQFRKLGAMWECVLLPPLLGQLHQHQADVVSWRSSCVFEYEGAKPVPSLWSYHEQLPHVGRAW